MKTVWTYKSINNSTSKKFLIIHEYEIDNATALESGTFIFGMEGEKADSAIYSGADQGRALISKISIDAVKNGFVVEKMFDGVNTYIADENADIENDEKFWSKG